MQAPGMAVYRVRPSATVPPRLEVGTRCPVNFITLS